MKVLYVSDLDGTLITRNERISEYSLGILNALIGRGLLFTYATARSLDSADRAVAWLKHSLPVVIYNGALILDPVSREPSYSVSFGKNAKEALVERLSSFGVSPVVHARESGEDKILWVRGRESEGQSRYLARRSGDKRMAPVETESGLMRGEAYFFACNGNYPLMKKIHDALEREGFYSLIYPEAYREEYWLEILPGGATKANAALKLKELLCCEKLVCFGDSANDSELFDVCDEKYAVMNADEWLKRKATGTVGYCEEDGVTKWLAENAVFGG